VPAFEAQLLSLYGRMAGAAGATPPLATLRAEGER